MAGSVIADESFVVVWNAIEVPIVGNEATDLTWKGLLVVAVGVVVVMLISSHAVFHALMILQETA